MLVGGRYISNSIKIYVCLEQFNPFAGALQQLCSYVCVCAHVFPLDDNVYEIIARKFFVSLVFFKVPEIDFKLLRLLLLLTLCEQLMLK